MIVVLLPLLLVGGCGGDEATSAPPPADGTPQEQVTEVVEHYFESLADGDGDAFCEVLTPEAQKIAAAMGEVGSCGEVPGKLKAGAPGDQLDLMREIEVTGTDVDADQAEARIALRGERAVEPIKLQRHEGRWKISAFATAAGLQRQRAESDVDGCIAAGTDAFDAGDADPFWKRQGRAKFITFIRQYCGEAIERGADSDSEQLAIRDEVVEEMVQRGQIPQP